MFVCHGIGFDSLFGVVFVARLRGLSLNTVFEGIPQSETDDPDGGVASISFFFCRLNEVIHYYAPKQLPKLKGNSISSLHGHMLCPVSPPNQDN